MIELLPIQLFQAIKSLILAQAPILIGNLRETESESATAWGGIGGADGGTESASRIEFFTSKIWVLNLVL